MSEPTKEKLAAALRAEGFVALAERAHAGEFDDFESEEHDLPKVALVAALLALDTPAAERFAARVTDGEFDNTREEAEAWLRSYQQQQGQDPA